jgi:hypothetical protein
VKVLGFNKIQDSRPDPGVGYSVMPISKYIDEKLII